ANEAKRPRTQRSRNWRSRSTSHARPGARSACSPTLSSHGRAGSNNSRRAVRRVNHLSKTLKAPRCAVGMFSCCHSVKRAAAALSSSPDISPGALTERTAASGRGLLHARLRCELRGDVAVEDGGADMIEPALGIGPDLAADLGPALAEAEVLAEIDAGLRLDQALEQREAMRVVGERILDRMLAPKLQRLVVGAHLFDRGAADHQEPGTGVAHPDEAAAHDDVLRIVDLEHVVERCRARIGPARLDHLAHLGPVGPLD